MYAGAYYALHEVTDPAGYIGPSGTVQTGLDWYYRAFGGTRNRWGDYSGASVDPSDDTTFWIFNEYAETRGTPISGEDGRWGTAWLSCALSCLSLDCPPDTVVAKNSSVPVVFCGLFPVDSNDFEDLRDAIEQRLGQQGDR